LPQGCTGSHSRFRSTSPFHSAVPTMCPNHALSALGRAFFLPSSPHSAIMSTLTLCVNCAHHDLTSITITLLNI
jgi:hypothetical protein